MKTMNFSKIAISSCILAGLLTAGCEVTDRVPETAITDLTYWTKVEDLEAYTRNFYPNFIAPRDRDNGTPNRNLLDEATDIAVAAGYNNRLSGTLVVPENNDGWANSDWEYIRKANYFMTHYQTVTGADDDINHYLGEARFFRAYEYFNKLKKFGDVPWYDKDLTTADLAEIYKPRDDRRTVTANIIADLEFAATKMKDPALVSPGRLHKYAAYQFLARVCLYEGTWEKYHAAHDKAGNYTFSESDWKPLLEKAESAALAVMNSGLYDIVKNSNIDMMDATDHPLYYKAAFIQEDLVDPAYKECVLGREFTSDYTHGLGRQAALGASKNFIESFLCIDGKPITAPHSGFTYSDDSVVVEFANRDPRLWNMIANRYVPSTISGTTPQSRLYYPPQGSEESANTGYPASKLKHPGQQGANATTTDWYIFRYAEALLICAEAQAELGKTVDLANTINKLRARVDMPAMEAAPAADPNPTLNYGYSISPLLYEIRRERMIELAFEGFRWDDINRWCAGTLVEEPKTMLGIVVNDDVRAQYTAAGLDASTISDEHTLLLNGKRYFMPYDLSTRPSYSRPAWDDKLYLDPLPKNQINLYRDAGYELKQNPGW